MQWYESEDAAVEALESATEYLWGLDWDRDKIELTILTRLNEIEDGIALNPLNPYFIPEQEELPDEPDCGCRVPGDICSEGEYVGRCDCGDYDNQICDVCAGSTSEGHNSGEDSVAADGSLTDVLCRIDHLYALALRSAERLEQIELRLAPKQFISPQFPGWSLQKQAQGGTIPNRHQQAYNRGGCEGGNCCRCGSH